jgi:helix-turn-helix protein
MSGIVPPPCTPRGYPAGSGPDSCETRPALVAGTDLPLARVAGRCGFGSSETLRQAFLDTYGRTPSEHRRAFRVPVTASGRRG